MNTYATFNRFMVEAHIRPDGNTCVTVSHFNGVDDGRRAFGVAPNGADALADALHFVDEHMQMRYVPVAALGKW